MFSAFIKSLLPSRVPIISQIAHRSNRFFIPDWNLPHSTCGPRSRDIYKPHVMKRIAAHGLTHRLQSRGGKQLLWRKIIQGKKGYVTFVCAP